jgi:hypothetical protein
MLHVTRDLRDIIEAVAIHGGKSITVCDEPAATLSREGGTEAVSLPLAKALYRLLYCRPLQRTNGHGSDTRATRIFIDALSRANSGTGSWQPGWMITSVEDDGSLAVQRPGDDLIVWARRHEFRPDRVGLGIGCAGRLRLGKELREMLPGYYTVLGEADQRGDNTDSGNGIIRFYWHLTADAARLWIRELTRLFNGADVAFHAKVLNDPGAYIRADAGVLYVARTDLTEAMALLPDLHRAVSPLLRETTPMFTMRLTSGLAVAEDPGDGRSFGEHRCRLVAEGLARAFKADRSGPHELADSVAARFAEDGLDITRPWLNRDSREHYAWPRASSPSRRLSMS